MMVVLFAAIFQMILVFTSSAAQETRYGPQDWTGGARRSCEEAGGVCARDAWPYHTAWPPPERKYLCRYADSGLGDPNPYAGEWMLEYNYCTKESFFVDADEVAQDLLADWDAVSNTEAVLSLLSGQTPPGHVGEYRDCYEARRQLVCMLTNPACGETVYPVCYAVCENVNRACREEFVFASKVGAWDMPDVRDCSSYFDPTVTDACSGSFVPLMQEKSFPPITAPTTPVPPPTLPDTTRVESRAPARAHLFSKPRGRAFAVVACLHI